MKKTFIMLIVALTPMISIAQSKPIFGKYGFENQTSIEAYQKYVGKTVVYLPCSPLNYAEKEVFKTQKFIPETEYIITSISPKSGELLSYSKITIVFKEKHGKKKLTGS